MSGEVIIIDEVEFLIFDSSFNPIIILEFTLEINIEIRTLIIRSNRLLRFTFVSYVFVSLLKIFKTGLHRSLFSYRIFLEINLSYPFDWIFVKEFLSHWPRSIWRVFVINTRINASSSRYQRLQQLSWQRNFSIVSLYKNVVSSGIVCRRYAISSEEKE